MAGVLAGECSYSESGVSSHAKQDEVDMRDEEGVCSGSIGNLAHQIPLDLTIEIMTRFPVKSLIRFQAVSKEWLSIIESQVFINKFNSISQTQSRFLVAVRTHVNRLLLLSSSNHETEVLTTSTLQMPIPKWLVNPVRYTSLHTNLDMTVSGLPVDLVRSSSVHGLFSLSFKSHPGRFTIYNPSTRQAITLPDNKPSSGRRERIYLFLGYDPVSNEYKALSSAVFSGECFQEHKVFTIGGGSGFSWREIEGTKITRYTVATNNICINGIVYCGVWTTRRQEKRPMIFWFNVRNEKIGYIRTYSWIISGGSLINYNGSLAVALPCDTIHCFEICILDEYKLDKVRWLRIPFNVDPLLSDLSGNIQLSILGKNKTNEFVLGPVKLPPKHEPLYIYYYNRGKDLIRRVELEGFEVFGCTHKSDEKCDCQVLLSADHFESLVSL